MNENKLGSLGKILIKYRKELNFTQKDIASKLCLKLELIRNIENDIFPDNIPLVFYCGYIYSYARLVNLSKKKIVFFIKEYKKKFNLSNKIIERKKKINESKYFFLNFFFLIKLILFLFVLFFLNFCLKLFWFNN